VAPLECPLAELVFNQSNTPRLSLAHGTASIARNEAWFFYPSRESTICDRYVVVDLASGWWAPGRLQRTASCDGGAWSVPLFADPAGLVQAHETGWLADGQPRHGDIWIETAELSAARGARSMTVRAIVPDYEGEADMVALRFFLTEQPRGPERQLGPFVMPVDRDWVEVRFTAMQVRARIEALADGPWALGVVGLDAIPGAGR